MFYKIFCNKNFQYKLNQSSVLYCITYPVMKIFVRFIAFCQLFFLYNSIKEWSTQDDERAKYFFVTEKVFVASATPKFRELFQHTIILLSSIINYKRV